jgi:PAS domain S-box-containing protein
MSNQPSKKYSSGTIATLREKVSQLERSEQQYRRLEKELQDKAADLNLINDLNQAFNRGDTLPELLDLLANETKRLYASKGATIYVVSPDKKHLILFKHKTVLNGLRKITSLVSIDAPPQIVIPLQKDGVYYRILYAGMPQIINDPHTIENMIADCTTNVILRNMAGMFLKLLNISSIITAPLLVGNKPIGFLDISRNIPFTEYELGRFENLSKYVALLLHHVQTEQYLKESESRYRSFVTNFQGIAYHGNLDFTAIFFHGAVSEITGYTENDFITGKPRWNEIIYRDDLPQLEESIRRIAKEPDYSCEREYRIIRKDGTMRWVREYSKNICGHNGKPIAVEGAIYDVSNERQALDALSLSEKKFRQFFEQEPTYCYMVSPEGIILDINNATLAVLEYEKDELIGKPINMVYTPECREKANDLFQQWKITGVVDDAELTIVSKSGSRRTILLSARGVRDESGHLIHSVSVQKDITAQKYAEEQIRSSLEEKKALLKEIHHRVKNNLQVISSLLNLQSQYIDNEQYQHFFKESQDRIKTMVLIHEKLYQSENLAAISPSDYINGIVHNLLDSYRTGTGEVAYESTIEDFSVDIDLAIPCGLIVNELVSNAMKHAFNVMHTDDKPRITINLTKHKDQITLVVSDNGPGLPPDIDFRKTKTLGLQLVHSLAKQLDARTTVDRHAGTSFTFTFCSKT